MKNKILTFLFTFLIFGYCSVRANLAPGDYQLIEVNTAPENMSHDPYLYDVKIIEKEKGQLFMIFTKSRFVSDALISKEVEILQTKNSVMFELRAKFQDYFLACIYTGAPEGNSILGSFIEAPNSTTGRFRLVPKK